MEKKMTMTRIVAAILCFMISIWSLFGMFTVPYCIAMKFPLIERNEGVEYHVQMDTQKARELWLQWRYGR